jgi:hypothetical protein
MIPFRSKLKNIHTYTIFTKQSDVVGIFGVMPIARNESIGRIWFLASDLIEEHYLDFLRKNKRWLSYLEEHYSYVSNYIISENETSIKWLKWQGFSFRPQHTLVKGVKIMYFYKRLPSVTKYGTQPILDEIGPKWATDIV